MLIAWIRGKRGRYKKEYEDEIVSAVFGPLCYLPGPERGEVFRRILDKSFACALAQCEDCDIKFWPNLANRGRIEPDIVVELPSTILLIEAKWNSPPSKNQLATQWDAAKERYPHQKVWHLFLTKQPYSMEEMTLDRGIGQDHSERLASMTWSQLAHIAQAIAKTSPSRELTAWVGHMCEFLRGLGEAPFVGFLDVVIAHRDWDAGYRWHFQPSLLHLSDLMNAYSDWTHLWAVPTWHFNIKK